MSIRLLQSIFLIVGTAVGAGILALPITTVGCGFWGSVIALTITWVFMTMSASNMIKARLCFQGEADLATMTTNLLGRSSNVVVEICYLALLLALVSMYITVGSAWISELITAHTSLALSPKFSQIAFTMVIGGVIYSGMGNLTTINKVVTIFKMLFLIMIIILSVPSIEAVNLRSYSTMQIPMTLSMLITTFGFSIVLPSLAAHLNHDRQKLYIALVIGSILILLAYLAWELIAFGVIGPFESGLALFAQSPDKGTEVINSLSQIVNRPVFNVFGFGVMMTAVLTSFMGVGHCLFSYLKDTLPIKNASNRSIASIVLGLAAPVIIINLYPAGVSSILSFAGIFVAIILGLLPTAMILSKEYTKRKGALSQREKVSAIVTIIFFIGIIIVEAWRILS